MGKRLIIKGADFTENRLKRELWHYTMGSSTQTAYSSDAYSPIAISLANSAILVGKSINTIKIYSFTGQLLVSKLSGATLTQLATYEISETGFNVLTLPETVILNEGERIVFSGCAIGGCKYLDGLSDDYTDGITMGFSYTTNPAEPCGNTGGDVYLLTDYGFIE